MRDSKCPTRLCRSLSNQETRSARPSIRRATALLAVFFFLGIWTGVAAQQSFYFADPLHGGPAGREAFRFPALNAVNLNLELRTRSVEDQNRFPPLIIDDYRYDEPNYFADHRVPNVKFLVFRRDRYGVETPARYRVGSQGGGRSLSYLRVNAWFQLGRGVVGYWLLDHFGFFPVANS